MTNLTSSNEEIAMHVCKAAKSFLRMNSKLSSEYSTNSKNAFIRCTLMGFNSSWNTILIRVTINDVEIEVVEMTRVGESYNLKYRVNFNRIYDIRLKKGTPVVEE